MAERMGDVVGGPGRRLGGRRRATQEPPLIRHTQDLLEVFEGLGELRRAQMEHLGDLLRLARLSTLLQGRVDAGGHDGGAGHATAITVLHQFHIHVLCHVHGPNVEAVVGRRQRDLLKDLEETAFFVGQQIPGVVAANTGHGHPGRGVAALGVAQNNGAERGAREAGVHGRSHTTGIGAAALLEAEEAVLGATVDRALHDIAAACTDGEFVEHPVVAVHITVTDGVFCRRGFVDELLVVGDLVLFRPVKTRKEGLHAL